MLFCYKIHTCDVEIHGGLGRHAIDGDDTREFSSILWEDLNDNQGGNAIGDGDLVVRGVVNLHTVAVPLYTLWLWVRRKHAFQDYAITLSRLLVLQRLCELWWSWWNDRFGSLSTNRGTPRHWG